MKTVTVQICLGTTCYVMGASDLQTLAEHLPEHLRDRVEVEGVPCLELCKDRRYGQAPYARIDGEVVSEATVAGLLERIAARLGEAE